MSKNTRNTTFRNVDVDKYDDEKYEEETVVDDGITGPNDAEVQTMINNNKLSAALQHVLSNAPVTSKNQAVKDKAVQTVLKVLTAYKSSDIDAAVKQLDQSKQDVLMKYIYRGFEMSSDGAALLVWHDKVFAVSGLGCIVRALADRKHV